MGRPREQAEAYPLDDLAAPIFCLRFSAALRMRNHLGLSTISCDGIGAKPALAQGGGENVGTEEGMTRGRPPIRSLRHALQDQAIEAGGECRGVVGQFAVEDLSLLQQ